MYLVNAHHFPCHIQIMRQISVVHRLKPQMTKFQKNSTGAWNGLLACARRRNHAPYEPSGRHLAWRCIQATLTNTSCPTSRRAAGLLYGFWIGWCEGSRHVKVPGNRNQREETASQGRRSPTVGILADSRGRVCRAYSLSGEAISHGHCGSSVSPISQVNQWLR